MNVIELIQKYGVEYLGRYYSKYRGIVVGNQDPNNTSKLEIALPTVHPGLTVWARPYNIYGACKSGFKYLLPKIGEVVWVEFEMGDLMKPIWSYHPFGKDETPDELKDIDSLGFITPSGNKVYLKESEGILHILCKQGVELKIEGEEEGKISTALTLSKDNIKLTREEDKVQIEITSEGINISKGSNNLLKFLSDLIENIQALTVTTGIGPSGPPINIADFEKRKQELNQFLV